MITPAPLISISREQLKQAIADWVLASREWRTIPQAEADAMSVDENAESATRQLWIVLGGTND